MTDLLARCDAASATRVIAAQNARASLPSSYYQD
jgi:hypothetical protein